MDIQTLLISLQTRIDNGAFMGVPKGKQCQGEIVDDGLPGRCPRQAVLPLGGKVECSLHKYHKVETELKYLCLIHLLQDTSGKDMPTPLLAIMNGQANAGDVYSEKREQNTMDALFTAENAERIARQLDDKARQTDPAQVFVNDDEDESDILDSDNDPEVQAMIAGDAYTLHNDSGHIGFAERDDDPDYCVCDWLISSPLARTLHDDRHKNWLMAQTAPLRAQESPETASEAVEVPTETKPAKKERKPRATKATPAKAKAGTKPVRKSAKSQLVETAPAPKPRRRKAGGAE